MDQFQKKFIEEATDHINDLEQSLLELENNKEDKGLVEQAFRAMHSLKGGGSMFGFELVSDFTHHLETIFDMVRNDELNVTNELLTLSLNSLDHITYLLENNELADDKKAIHDELIDDINMLMNDEVVQIQKTNGSEEELKLKTYCISFKPFEEIFNNGTNPLYLIDELYTVGKCVVFPIYDNIPNLSELDAQKSYMSWSIIMSTKEGKEAIEDVFIFVEDDCEIDIEELAAYDLLEDDEFIKNVKSEYDKTKHIDANSIKKFINKIKENAKGKGKSLSQTNKSNNKDSNQIASIRVDSSKIDDLMNMVSELVTTQARLSLYAEQQSIPELTVIAENVAKLSRQLRDNAFSISLIPLKNVITRFQRLVRDLSGELGKDIRFDAEGTETELDKSIIESLTDPIMHILRNSLDHGIETAAQRKEVGKEEQGRILLKAYYSGTNVHIQISDNGRGLDEDVILAKAIKLGLTTPEIKHTSKEIFDFIFHAGFSTAKNVTDVSGRGVGMDVVRRKIADIRGDVDLDSVPGEGTTVTIKLPVTLSIIDGLLVQVENSKYIIPLSVVNKIYPVENKELKDNFTSMIILDGEQVPYHYLREYFNVMDDAWEREQVVVVNYEDKKIGVIVDEVVGEYQAVLKPLGTHYKDQELISGATILGDGSVALVLDTNKIIRQFSEKLNEL